jgi:transcriptional regulator with XRE-family HTH domain
MKSDHPFQRWIKASGYSVREVARECGVSRTAVYNWCYGLSPPNNAHLATLYRLSHGAVQPWFWIAANAREGSNDASR